MNKLACIFPGQASQFPGMGKDMYDINEKAKSLFEAANEIMGFKISDVMFHGSEEELKATRITQPSVFLHSVIKYICHGEPLNPAAVAGHSLGEFSALVASQVLSFEDALRLVDIRAKAMQEACELNPGTMAAVVGLEDLVIEKVCEDIGEEVVVAANYNCPGQLVISGSLIGIQKAEQKLIQAGAKRVIILNVGGAFHSSLMEPARETLADAIENIEFCSPICPVYQNVDALPETDSTKIKDKLIRQLTAPVKWSQTMQAMIDFGIDQFYEVGGNGTVLSGFLKRIDRNISIKPLE
ncbi:MAG: ACP S-malonyltransferase [Bacteroidota bacterium]|nr:ACP S-malonyltransferase [Bacteroidota bacterium]